MPTPASPVYPGPGARRTDSLLGIALFAAGMFIFSAVDAQAKFLTQTLHPIQIVWCRQLGLVAGLVVLLAWRGVSILKTDAPKLQIARGALAAGSASLFIFGVAYVPLADAVAVSFVAPFIVTLLGALVLRERVGIRRWTAVLIGFLGMLIVVRPGLGVLHPGIFLVILAASCFAVRQIISRALSGTDSTMTTVAYTALVSVAILTVPLPFVWTWPQTGMEVALLVSIAVLAAIAETCVIKSLEVAEAVVVAPLQYTLLIWGTFYGWLVFSDLPDLWTWVGASIIIATGIYTLHRERIVARARR